MINREGMKAAALELLRLQGKVAEAEALENEPPMKVVRAAYDPTPPGWKLFDPQCRKHPRCVLLNGHSAPDCKVES